MNNGFFLGSFFFFSPKQFPDAVLLTIETETKVTSEYGSLLCY